MSEDFILNRNKKEEDRTSPDFFGSLGKGMPGEEDVETLKTSSGLTPIGFGIRNTGLTPVQVREGLSSGDEMLRNSAGLSPLRPLAGITKRRFLNER